MSDLRGPPPDVDVANPREPVYELQDRADSRPTNPGEADLSAPERTAATCARELAAEYAVLASTLPEGAVAEIMATSETVAALAWTVRRYSAALRAVGASPEHALVLVKTTLREGAVLTGEPEKVLMEHAVRWFVEGYYAA